MLKVENLSKKYGKTLVVKDVSFEVNDGEIAVLLGPNGAGKSTTIKSILGLLKTKGEIKVNGYENKSIEAKRDLGFIPEMPVLYDWLTIEEHVEFVSKAYGIENYKDKMEEYFEIFDLKDKRGKLGRELSKGMQQKVSIICALITNPKVVLFDEPMIGLDPKAIKAIKKIIKELKNDGCTIVISTHIIESVDELWDRALIMDKGEIIVSKLRDEIEEGGESLEEIFFRVTEKINKETEDK
ncbi:MAG: ABC transporter ATP-binding protein [Clostridium argentinense]|uniref:ABC transporter ATP-binding protein n=1 Tax=Clostridium faecium TaxID=2762223 RepID=A0ABR8YTJ1_9CLOT|nr:MULTISPECIES: ABC transporter ATP-binding protein [Clostridium]MBD8047582.1 ABC transporter ATP-binding protein [Clostridium faecium]MBS5824424.1 ABC transporter ATP-binding protein [Clostridium argentinense]MDU1349950.1 ABC transporter ATP-binding protein [Clostridium argentinense]